MFEFCNLQDRPLCTGCIGAGGAFLEQETNATANLRLKRSEELPDRPCGLHVESL